MEPFRTDGHLTDETLATLARGRELDELTRLEAAEHLAFCDACLQRYTDLLATAPLLVPAHSCRESLWVRVRRRTLRLVTSRYATAAAAVALALTVLWGSAAVSLPEAPRHFQSWPERWSNTLDSGLSRLNTMFDDLGGAVRRPAQGGNS